MRYPRFRWIVYLAIVIVAGEDGWENTYFKPSSNVTLESGNGTLQLTFDEEGGSGFVIGEFLYSGSGELTWEGKHESYFQIEKKTWILKTKQNLDYETPEHRELNFRVVEGTLTLDITIVLVNINDNPIVLSGPSCNQLENNAVGHVSKCQYNISDRDGLSDKLSFGYIAGNSTDRFEMDKKAIDLHGNETAKLLLVFLKEEDYETENVILLIWTAKDEKYEDNLSIVIRIGDEPDEPPVWVNTIGSITLKELDSYMRQLEAYDGDIGINNPIGFRIKEEDIWKEIKIVDDKLIIDPITLENPNDNSIQFTLIAYETIDESSWTPQTVFLMIEDINNHKPEITVQPLALTIEEESNGRLKGLDVDISDMDAGKFGTYDVSLKSPEVENINEIFQVIPNTGYQHASFSILIKDGSQLDYDLPEMSEVIHLHIEAVDDDPTHIGKEEITITLKDLNDEEPIWQEAAYSVRVLETFGRTSEDILPIPEEIKFYAVDLDKEPVYNTITYEIVGDSGQRLLVLEEKQPQARANLVLKANKQTVAKQLFDYEREPSVVITILASDGLNNMTTQLTIDLIDVNDELPTLSATPQSITIKEKITDPDAIQIRLDATDADQGAKLEFNILKDKSFVYKLGVEQKWADHECIFIDARTGKLTLDVSRPPDYQVYDSIYLQLEVSDLNGEDPKEQRVERTVIINIQNVHDLDPLFENTSFADIRVIEHSDYSGRVTLVGVIKATDPDGPGWPPITYKIIPRNGTDDNLITIIASSGELWVAGDIEADPDKFKLVYDVTARTEDRFTTKELTIHIRDINDHKPEATKAIYKFKIKEHDEHAEPFNIETVSDGDRDESNKLFECYASNMGELADIYNVTTDSNNVWEQKGCVITIINGSAIDYDGGVHAHIFNIIVRNYLDEKSEKVSIPVEISIIDINDNKPSIQEGVTFKTNENAVAGENLGIIQGVDIDSGRNAEITYELLKVERQIEENGPNDIVLKPHDFKIEKVIEIRDAKLIISKNLRDHYGTYTLTFKAKNDKSDINLETSDNQVTLIVERVNTKLVLITYPEDNEVFVLKNVQEINTKLVTKGGAPQRSLSATDQQQNKYAIQFSICDDSGNNIDDENFRIATQDGQTADLHLKKLDVLAAGNYDLYVKAESIDANPALTAPVVHVYLKFLNENASPVFKVNTFTCDMDEEYIGSLDCKLPEASSFFSQYAAEEDAIKYFIFESEPVDAYEIQDKSKNRVHVTKKIDLVLLTDDYSAFTVEATFGNVPSINPSPTSLLNVTMNINDINNHPPTFPERNLMGALIIGMAAAKKLDIHLKADDPDRNDKLHYSIDWDTYTTSSGHNLPGPDQRPFQVRNTNDREGELLVKFNVQPSMSGLIQFNVIVEDIPQPTGRDSSDKVQLDLYIIADKHLCSIMFENLLTDIESKEDEVVAVLEEQFQYRAGISDKRAAGDISRATYDDDIPTGTTEVIVYFIDTNKKVGIEKEVIKAQINNLEFFSQLKKKFLEHSLVVKNVIIPIEAESLEETYKIALIVVSCVFGVLLAIVIGYFTYRIRTTNNRLDRLDQAEARRPTMVHNLPGANRRATQAVNPNIPQAQEDDTESNDYSFANSRRNSISKKRNSFDDTDDEDFVGVENNDIFKISPDKH